MYNVFKDFAGNVCDDLFSLVFKLMRHKRSILSNPGFSLGNTVRKELGFSPNAGLKADTCTSLAPRLGLIISPGYEMFRNAVPQ